MIIRISVVLEAADGLYKLPHSLATWLTGKEIWYIYLFTGTTWVSEIVWNLLNEPKLAGSHSALLDERVPYLEWVYPGVKQLNSRLAKSDGQRRVMKTHLPHNLLPKQILDSNCKVYILYTRFFCKFCRCLQ